MTPSGRGPRVGHLASQSTLSLFNSTQPGFERKGERCRNHLTRARSAVLIPTLSSDHVLKLKCLPLLSTSPKACQIKLLLSQTEQCLGGEGRRKSRPITVIAKKKKKKSEMSIEGKPWKGTLKGVGDKERKILHVFFHMENPELNTHE